MIISGSSVGNKGIKWDSGLGKNILSWVDREKKFKREKLPE